MKSAHDLIIESEAMDNALRAHPDSLQALMPIFEEKVEQVETEEVIQEDSDEPELTEPANDVVDSPELSDVPSADIGASDTEPLPAAEPDDVPSFDEPSTSAEEPVEETHEIPEIESAELSEIGVPDVEASAPEELPDTEQSGEQLEPVPSEDSPSPESDERTWLAPQFQTEDSATSDEFETPEHAEVELESLELPDVETAIPDAPDVPAVEQTEVSTEDTPDIGNTISHEPLPDIEMTEDWFGLPEVSVSTQELSEPNDEPVGFQGLTVLPSVQMDSPEDPSMKPDDDPTEAGFRQMERQHKESEDLAARLAEQLDPAFDELRMMQDHAIQDAIQRQVLFADAMRVM